ncbi:MAG: integrase arm-type DNA-binding domain-containing protein [Deltaproteobacteria bacterium]|nr:integrase arm-type DNA-binding domain-containing protein [Deltaproteobacteria bacterium]
MLTDKQCRNAKCSPDKRRLRLTDAQGLYLEVSPPSERFPDGSKRWFQKLYIDGKDTRIALGSYPFVSLADARRKQADVKAQRKQKLNPIDERRRAQAQQVSGDTFGRVSQEWYSKQMAGTGWADGGVRVRRFLSYLLPDLGERPMNEIEPPELLATLKKLEQRGVLSTAERVRGMTGQIWRYARQTGRVQSNIAEDLRGALAKHVRRHRAAVTTPEEVARIVSAVRAYAEKNPFRPIRATALQLAIMLFQRPGELRRMRWEHIDWEAATWAIPSAVMKGSQEAKLNGEPQIVPLPRQAQALLAALRPFTDIPACGGWVFPGEQSKNMDRPMHENAMNIELVNCGIPRGMQSIHGFRATARTILDEGMDFDWRHLEAQLAHVHAGDPNRGAYIRAKYIEQRRKMLQVWADYLDALAEGVEPERAAEIAKAAKVGRGAQR